jgi:hypothetical protein
MKNYLVNGTIFHNLWIGAIGQHLDVGIFESCTKSIRFYLFVCGMCYGNYDKLKLI